MTMTDTRQLSPDQRELLTILREAKQARIEAGTDDNPAYAHANQVLADAERGQFPPGYGGDTRAAVQQLNKIDDVFERPDAGTSASNQFGTYRVKMASDAQTRYIARLLRDRQLDAASPLQARIIEMARPQIEAGKINKKHASAVLDVLTSLPVIASPSGGNPAKGDPNRNKRTNRYGGKCVHCGSYVQAEAGWLTKDAAGKWASEHKDGECVEAKPVRDWTTADSGIYRDSEHDTIWKVYCAVHGSRKMCAKELVVTRDEDDEPTGEFVYRGLAERFIDPAWLMSMEEAKEYGQIYGFCVVCGTTLTDETSIQEGIGPVCGGRVKSRRKIELHWKDT